jgi:Tol biopolymer transport system component
VAADGTLVYRSGGIVNGDELVMVDRTGRDIARIGEPGNFYHPRLSPDGTMVAVDKSDETNRGDIWIYDVDRRAGTRLTSAPQDESVPAWSPDGRILAFVSNREAPMGAVHVRSLRGRDDEEVLYRNPAGGADPWSWSRDGLIVVNHYKLEADSGSDIGTVAAADGTFEPFLATRFDEKQGVLSPDGKFIAYTSDETGRPEVYIQTFPDPAESWRVSANGGVGPLWRADGGELYYVVDRAALAAVSVRANGEGSSLEFGEPEVLFTTIFKEGAVRRPFDTIDGRAFILNRAVGDNDPDPLTLVVNALPPKNN